MTTIHLGYEIDSGDANRAAIDLDKMAQASERAEAGQRGLTAATSANAGAARQGATATQQFERTIDGVAAANARGAAASRVATSALQMQAAATGMARARMQQMSFQINDIATMLLMGASPFQIMATQGGQLVQIYQGQGGVNQAIRDTGRMIAGVVRYAGPLIAVVGAVGAAIAGMRSEINRTSDVTVSFGDTALAVWQTIRDGLWSTVKPAVDSIAPWFAAAWEGAVAGLHVAGNAIINGVRAAVEGVKVAVSTIPDIFSAVFNRAAANVAMAIDDMIFNVGNGINTMIEGINGAFGTSLPTVPTSGASAALSGFAQDRLNAAHASTQAADAAYGNLQSRVGEIMGSDPLGGFFDAVRGNAIKNAMNGVEDASKKAGGAAATAGKKAKDAWEGLKGFVDDARGAFSSAFSSILRGSESVGEAISKMLDRIADKLLTMAGNSIFDALFGGWFGGGATSGAGGQVRSLSHLIPSAMGNVFRSGQVVAFANGGIVGGPTMFPMRGGNVGLMGEAGEEAIVPLRRGSNGRLGVEASGGGGGTVDVRVSVDNNGNLQAFVERISGHVTAAGLENANANFNARAEQRDRDPRVRFG